jgi:wyosine [tRNA(Phe)-imidazoG37] synthetase (radical SAM superfamily)
MSYIYGPVPSRRLGQSLGVDPIPFKTCNYNCVYCQLGRTTPLTNERKEYVPCDEILAELRRAIAELEPTDVDYITIVGEGEPLLYSQLGRLIREAKEMTNLPLAVITNGSLMSLPEVREDLADADVVIPSLDAADQETFRRINRPWPKLKIADIIDGMAAFREESRAELWIEVMLIQNLNDTEEALHRLAWAVRRIGPDEVHLNLPVRPPAEDWVRGTDEDGLIRAMAILGRVATVVPPEGGALVLREDVQPVDAVLEIIPRHPLRERDLIAALESMWPSRVGRILAILAAHPDARRHIYRGEAFWTYAGAKHTGES